MPSRTNASIDLELLYTQENNNILWLRCLSWLRPEEQHRLQKKVKLKWTHNSFIQIKITQQNCW
jgi:hypothetical protein